MKRTYTLVMERGESVYEQWRVNLLRRTIPTQPPAWKTPSGRAP
jgi:hypothetical protein